MTHEYITTVQVTAWSQAGGPKIRVCGHDCRQGDEHCNGYCTGHAEHPPEREPQPGYAVKHGNGHVSWMPKGAFEAAYIDIGHVSHLLPHQQRVIAEKAHLDDRLAKLKLALDGGMREKISREEFARLCEQERVMREYSAILAARIAAF